MRCLILSLALFSLTAAQAAVVHAGNLKCTFEGPAARPVRLESRVGKARRVWLNQPVSLQVRNEATGAIGMPTAGRWSASGGGWAWDLSFTSDEKRAGHEVSIELPMLDPKLEIFTPGDAGVVRLSQHPDFKPDAYATYAWTKGTRYVLPLVSVFDPTSDSALTMALPADANIPHMQVEWRGARVLRLTFGHRGMGGGRPSPLRILFYAHQADYRSALKAYSDDFPAYFKAPLPPSKYEGAFYYHHIEDHPDFAEMARQNVRYIWTSFWFSHLGEYLPEETEWYPFTYARMWKLGHTMSDEKIHAFIGEMHAHGIGVYAYFNVTEYGGTGGRNGDKTLADRMLREKFANALIRDEKGEAIPTWEGAMDVNPDQRLSYWPHLKEQVERHLRRLPEIDGFIIDRLDWASRLDYAQDDGFSMVGERPVENLAVPVGEAVREVCRMAHQAGKRVLVNQFYRIEVLRDVDGVCHENDYLPGLGYLSPLRPMAAWHLQAGYKGDLTAFQAHLKQRLHWALQPQMIAHQFPISQQPPNPRAADLLESYAPLFARLVGARQVLLPHCVSATGEGDVNLFRNSAGQYIVPVSSPRPPAQPVTVTLDVPDGHRVTWAEVVSAGGKTAPAKIMRSGGSVKVQVGLDASAAVLVLGQASQRTKGI